VQEGQGGGCPKCGWFCSSWPMTPRPGCLCGRSSPATSPPPVDSSCAGICVDMSSTHRLCRTRVCLSFPPALRHQALRLVCIVCDQILRRAEAGPQFPSSSFLRGPRRASAHPASLAHEDGHNPRTQEPHCAAGNPGGPLQGYGVLCCSCWAWNPGLVHDGQVFYTDPHPQLLQVILSSRLFCNF
jgi:hypothetical protein